MGHFRDDEFRREWPDDQTWPGLFIKGQTCGTLERVWRWYNQPGISEEARAVLKAQLDEFFGSGVKKAFMPREEWESKVR